MSDPLFRPIELKFRGRDTDTHRIDGMQFGQSVAGTARLYNSVLHFWFHGQIPKRFYPTRIRVQVGPPTEGTLTYAIYAMLVHGEMALYPELLWELAELSVPLFLKAMLARKAGRSDHLSTALKMIEEQGRRHDEFAGTVHRDLMKTNDRLLDVIENLTKNNGPAMRDMAQPIGRTASSLTHFADRPEATIIDEPLAEALRSPEEVVVGDQQTYNAKIVGVDQVTGACRVELEGCVGDVRGKITDPSLTLPGNDARALYRSTDVTITAKPVTKDGAIKTLFISDATDRIVT